MILLFCGVFVDVVVVDLKLPIVLVVPVKGRYAFGISNFFMTWAKHTWKNACYSNVGPRGANLCFKNLHFWSIRTFYKTLGFEVTHTFLHGRKSLRQNCPFGSSNIKDLLKAVFCKCSEQTTKIPRGGKFARCVRTNRSHWSRKAPLWGLRCYEIPALILQLLLQNCTEQGVYDIFLVRYSRSMKSTN